MKIPTAILVLELFCLLSYSCSKDETKIVASERKIGKYIYQDDNDIHHIDAHCSALRHGKDDAGHEIYAKHMIDTSVFVIITPEYFRVCSRCVCDEAY